MKNSFDKNYRKIKKNIALKNKEITLLWNCGIKNRIQASKSNITKYTDKSLNPEKLGININSPKYNILNSMLITTNNNNLILLNKKNNYNNWQKKITYEFFVDFETYTPNFDELILLEDEINDNSQYIYMIGIGHEQIINNEVKYKFKCFIINYFGSEQIYTNIEKKYNCKKEDIITVKNEYLLIEAFINYIYSFKKNNEPEYKFLKKTRLIHWSSAEPCLFAKKLSKYNLNNTTNIFPWFDLMQVFKYQKYPIIIKNCFSFSLKEITKAMNINKMIELTWSDLDDGLLSTFIAKDIYKNINPDIKINNTNMQDIIEYNYIDCKALYLILIYIRKTLNKK